MAELQRSVRSRTISSSSSISVPSTPVTGSSGTFDFGITDVEELFKVNTIVEIKDAEKKIKGEIEKKKEDLRSMVGERYRDLIDAADTIKDMGHVTDQVFKGIVGMQRLCSEFEVEESIRHKKLSVENEVKNEKETNFYALATQMELLVDTPEKIWSALDRHEYLMAAQLYLLADHIVNNSLKIKAKRGRKNVFAKFPILHHQWAAISHFKASILKDTRASLKDVTLPDKNLSESLCSIILLENSSVREAFMEFLLSRKSAIQDVFHPSQHTTSVKNQVCNVARLIHLTILQTYNLFMSSEEASGLVSDSTTLINKTLLGVTAGDSATDEGGALQDLYGEDFDVLTVARHLPQTVLGFRPKLLTINLTIPTQNIQNNTKEWLNRCIDEVKSEVKKLLAFVKSVKGLASIRDTVYDLLKNFEDHQPTSAGFDNEDTSFWDRVSGTVLGESMSIWDTFFRSVFRERIEAIAGSEFELILKKAQKSIGALLTNLSTIDSTPTSNEWWDHNVGSFMWEESPTDIPGLSSLDDRTSSKKSGLILKAKSQTPSTVKLCTDVDSLIGKIVDDVTYYIRPDVEGSDSLKGKRQRESKHLFSRTVKEPFDKLVDSKHIEQLCSNSSEKLLTDIGLFVQLQIQNLENKLWNSTSEADNVSFTVINRILCLGRLSTCIPDNCPNLVNNIKNKFVIEAKDESQTRTLQKARSSAKGETNEVKAVVFEDLRRYHNQAVSIWKNWVVKLASKSFKDMLYNEEILIGFGTTGWEEVSIQEETESGQPVHSKIYIPSQLSFTLSSLLFRVTEEINRAGGQTFDKTMLKTLALDIGHTIIEDLTSFVDSQAEEHMWQERALQFMFDVKFLVNLLTGSTDSKDPELQKFRASAKELRDKLEQFVDPFDLDVFLPYINSYVTRQLQRSWLLLGILSAAERHSSQAFGQRLSLSSQEQHGVLPTNPHPVRFILLPVSTPGDKGLVRAMEGSGNKRSGTNKRPQLISPLQDHARVCSF